MTSVHETLDQIRLGRFTPDDAHPWMDGEFTASDYRKLADAALASLTEATTHIAAIRDEHAPSRHNAAWCVLCGRDAPCGSRGYAQKALALLEPTPHPTAEGPREAAFADATNQEKRRASL